MNAPHADLVGRLATVLEGEERLYLELRDLLQAERVHIADLDGARLEEVVREKETLVEEARLLEESRTELVDSLAASLGLEKARPNLRDLCEQLGPVDGGLRERHGRLAALVAAVRELLDLNAVSAGESLQHAQATLRLLGRLVPGPPTYGPGTPSPGPPAGRLVRQSA